MNKLLCLIAIVLLVSCKGYVERQKVAALLLDQYQYDSIDYKKEGVNKDHIFDFTETSMRYNGKPFSIDIPLDTIITVFGPYSRVNYGEGASVNYNNYFWDNIGLVVLSDPDSVVIKIDIHWDYILPDTSDLDYDYDDVRDIPKGFFKGKILLNGIPLDNRSDLKSFCENDEMKREIDRLIRRKSEGKYAKYYYYLNPSSFYRYSYMFHELFFYDYKRFDGAPLFGYVVKFSSDNLKMHSFGIKYEVRSNKDFLDIF